MSSVRYFAYGSNMLTARLRRRCPSAEVLTTAEAERFEVGFHKRGFDASGKATLVAAERSVSVVGTIYAIDSAELAELDRAEGSGYRRLQRFTVRCLHSGEWLETHTYQAIEHHDDLKPFDWYLALILAGIAEHGLGDVYAHRFRLLDSIRDEHEERPTRCEAMFAFRAAGITDYRALLISQR